MLEHIGLFARFGAGRVFCNGFNGWMSGGSFVWFVIFKLLFSALLIGLTVYFVYFILRSSGKTLPSASTNVEGKGEDVSVTGALAILNERFAKGDIDESTYIRMKEVLKGKAPSKSGKEEA